LEPTRPSDRQLSRLVPRSSIVEIGPPEHSRLVTSAAKNSDNPQEYRFSSGSLAGTSSTAIEEYQITNPVTQKRFIVQRRK
jgi:hypothetical protein